MRHYYCREIHHTRKPVLIDASGHEGAAEEFCQEHNLRGKRLIGVTEVNTRGEVTVEVTNGTATGLIESSPGRQGSLRRSES